VVWIELFRLKGSESIQDSGFTAVSNGELGVEGSEEGVTEGPVVV